MLQVIETTEELPIRGSQASARIPARPIDCSCASGRSARPSAASACRDALASRSARPTTSVDASRLVWPHALGETLGYPAARESVTVGAPLSRRRLPVHHGADVFMPPGGTCGGGLPGRHLSAQ